LGVIQWLKILSSINFFVLYPMKRVYELDVYKLAEALSDMVWHDFDKWNKKVQAKFPISIF
ncbi:MAG: hypothetical protein ACNYWU_03730, partial [Desulfobacterales bacterium]